MPDRELGRDVALAQAIVPAPRAAVAALFWDIAAWEAIWGGIDAVAVLYDDGRHQEFVMDVRRDGGREDVRTIRYLRDGGEIEFFSPQPPSRMDVHTGRWGFDDAPGGCRVTARRAYRLTRDGGETAAAYARRRREYAGRFEGRLEAILACFAAHYSAAGQGAGPGLGLGPGLGPARAARVRRG